MPVKRRITKARRELGSEDIQDHFYGPGSALLNAEGYCWPIAGKCAWRNLTPDEQAQVIAAMRTDWHRHHRTIMQAWHDRDDHALWCAQQHHGDPADPWSLTEFGTPA